MPLADYSTFSVTDNGSGMTEEVRAHIFEPFFTTKGTGKGTGLGLATCYGIVKQSNGFIKVRTQPGCGTTFTIYLPCVQNVATLQKSGENKEEASLPQGHGTILLVEDNASVRTASARTLRANGYSVLEAGNSQEAFKVLKEYGQEKLDMLLTDMVMPGMSGTDFADQLSPHYPGLEVLYISGYADESISPNGVLRSDIELLRKPFTSKSLIKKVHDILKH